MEPPPNECLSLLDKIENFEKNIKCKDLCLQARVELLIKDENNKLEKARNNLLIFISFLIFLYCQNILSFF